MILLILWEPASGSVDPFVAAVRRLRNSASGADGAKPKIILYDIESTSLDAEFGRILAIGWKSLGGRVQARSIVDYGSMHREPWLALPEKEKQLLADFRGVMEQADMVVTHYGKGFDEKMLNTRMLFHRLPLLPPIPHVDCYFVAKAHLKMASNRLARIQEFFSLDTKKTPLSGAIWNAAALGSPVDNEYVRKHVRADVKVLEEEYLLLRPLIRMHPKVHGPDSHLRCRVCGSHNTRREGTRIHRTGVRVQRYQCGDCGHYMTEVPVVKTKSAA